MNANQLASIVDDVRKLPADGPGRGRRLLRLTDLYASAEAAAALQAAAARAATEPGVAASVLALAHGVWGGGPGDRGALPDDAAARDRLRDALVSPEFLALLPGWIRGLREAASSRPGTGACTLATALELWLWTMSHFRMGEGSGGESISQATDELADALCPLLAARCLALEIAAGAAPGAPEDVAFRTDLCHVHAAHAAAMAGAVCAELVFGYRRHPAWDAEGCASCFGADELDALEGWIPGIASGARASGDVIEVDGSHPPKAGPCARFTGVDTFTRLRTRLDGCLTGARFARDRAAARLVSSVVPATKASKGGA